MSYGLIHKIGRITIKFQKKTTQKQEKKMYEFKEL